MWSSAVSEFSFQRNESFTVTETAEQLTSKLLRITQILSSSFLMEIIEGASSFFAMPVGWVLRH